VSEDAVEVASSSAAAASAAAFSCVVTGYRGHEEDLLRLRNSNRDTAVTREYMDWRYAQDSDAPAPKLVWLIAPDGQRVGVAAAVYRSYWRDGVHQHVAVLGDISLDPMWRGRGLGQLLLKKMTEALAAEGHVALVLPTEAARKSLNAIGWSTLGELIPRVLLTDVTGRLRRVVRSEWLAARLGLLFKAVTKARLKRQVDPGCRLELSRQFDASFDDLWREFPRKTRVLRDLAAHTLEWRYARHPSTTFEVARLMRGDRLVAYLVFNLAPHYATCFVYDLIASTDADARCLLALFATHCMALEKQDVIRIVLDDKHPHVPALRALGFMRREQRVPLQVYPATASADAWSLSLGDKDV
jgi:GNAT superfamily N-acetyltransferase